MTDAPPRGPFWRSPWFWATVAGLITIPAIRPFLVYEPPPPRVTSFLPAFELIDATGESVSSADLQGRVWIAGLFSTRCRSVCPATIEALAKLDRRMRDEGVEGVELFAVTIHPRSDRPRRLAAYAGTHDVPDTVHLLGGTADAVRRLVVEGFGADPLAPATGAVTLAHEGRLILIDRVGGIRGFYDTHTAGLDEVFHRARHVRDERPYRRPAENGTDP